MLGRSVRVQRLVQLLLGTTERTPKLELPTFINIFNKIKYNTNHNQSECFIYRAVTISEKIWYFFIWDFSAFPNTIGDPSVNLKDWWLLSSDMYLNKFIPRWELDCFLLISLVTENFLISVTSSLMISPLKNLINHSSLILNGNTKLCYESCKFEYAASGH